MYSKGQGLCSFNGPGSTYRSNDGLENSFIVWKFAKKMVVGLCYSWVYKPAWIPVISVKSAQTVLRD